MLNIKEMSFAYKRNKNLFENLELDIASGNIYGLLGKNGAGKSTLLKIMSGLLYYQKGSVTIDGLDVAKRLPKVLSDIYIIPEEFYLPDLSMEKYIELYSVFYPKFNESFLSDLIKEFGLDRGKKLHSLSYGQKKKFIIAFAIATECSIILMDEPTNGLDIPSKSKFRKIIASAINDERTFVISTHQVRDLENLIDPVIIIDEGRIIFNEFIETISSKLSFVKTDKENSKAKGKVFYTETVFGGNYLLTERLSDEESPLDFELLFNAVLSNTVEIVEHLNN